MTKSKRKSGVYLICLALAVVTVLTFLPLKDHEFLNFDDDDYVTKNAVVQSGLTTSGIRWAFTSTVSHHWHPVTWLSHMLDCQLFGLNPAGHHLMNLLLHVINTILLFVILASVTEMTWQSVFVAALFAIHPFHVESVAWVSERKDTVSTLFWLLAMAFYFRYAARPRVLTYLLSLIFFALGLMSKAMLVTLPAILLLLDFWPLKRIGFDSFIPPKLSPESVPLSRIILEKIPFFVLTAASSLIAFIVMKHGGIVASTAELAGKYRLANALTSYATYLFKTFLPIRLAPFYPHPGITVSLGASAASALLLIAISILVFYLGRRRRYLIVGWLWFLITLLPVIGLLQVGAQAMADRYTYVPLIGLFIMISFALADLLRKLPRPRISAGLVYTLITLILIPVTYRQVKHWRTGITLFEHTVGVTNNNYFAHNNLAGALGRKGDFDASIVHGQKSISIKPDYDIAYYNLGKAYYSKNDPARAVSYWKRALEINPRYPSANYNIAATCIESNQGDKAVGYLKAELRINPRHQRAIEALKTITTPPSAPQEK